MFSFRFCLPFVCRTHIHPLISNRIGIQWVCISITPLDSLLFIVLVVISIVRFSPVPIAVMCHFHFKRMRPSSLLPVKVVSRCRSTCFHGLPIRQARQRDSRTREAWARRTRESIQLQNELPSMADWIPTSSSRQRTSAFGFSVSCDKHPSIHPLTGTKNIVQRRARENVMKPCWESQWDKRMSQREIEFEWVNEEEDKRRARARSRSQVNTQSICQAIWTSRRESSPRLSFPYLLFFWATLDSHGRAKERKRMTMVRVRVCLSLLFAMDFIDSGI